MWKVKLDDKLWLAKGSETTVTESEAYIFPNIPVAQDQLKKVRRFIPYREAMMIAAFDSVE
jgi:hypothetical protein